MKQVLQGQSQHELCLNYCSIFLKGIRRDNSRLRGTARSVMDKHNAMRKILRHCFTRQRHKLQPRLEFWCMRNVHRHAVMCSLWKKKSSEQVSVGLHTRDRGLHRLVVYQRMKRWLCFNPPTVWTMIRGHPYAWQRGNFLSWESSLTVENTVNTIFCCLCECGHTLCSKCSWKTNACVWYTSINWDHSLSK